MSRILITGVSGYIGGPLLTEILLIPNLSVYAIVRTDEQADIVKGLNAIPLKFDLSDEAAVKASVIDNNISVVLHLANAWNFAFCRPLIEALAVVKSKTGEIVHFVHTSGGKMFSSHLGIHQRLDDTGDVYDVQLHAKSKVPRLDQARQTCTSTHELGEALGVRTYIVVPTLTYGPGKGFGNKVSIQLVEIIRMSVRTRKVFQIPEDNQEWPHIRIDDLVSLYIIITKSLLTPSPSTPYGKYGGYYFGVTCEIPWKALYEGVATSLFKRGLVTTPTPLRPTEEDIERLGTALGLDKAFVESAVGGACALTATNGRQLGWEPKYADDYLLTHVDDEVEFTLKHDSKLQTA